jgi:hypothetical protein
MAQGRSKKAINVIKDPQRLVDFAKYRVLNRVQRIDRRIGVQVLGETGRGRV